MMRTKEQLAADPHTPALEQLSATMDKCGSTWIPSQSINPLFSVAHHEKRRYVSDQRGRAEEYLSNWLHANREVSAEHVPLLDEGLTTAQTEAGRMILANKVSCLEGLPGSGKTHLMRRVAESLIMRGSKVLGCSYSGIAAKRLGDMAGIQSSTMHRLLEWDGEEFCAERIHADCVMIDEAGFSSAGMILAVASRLTPRARMILVGDRNQLKSIEPGDAFAHLCGILPHSYLDDVIRQEYDSPIGLAASHVLGGRFPLEAHSPCGVGGFYLRECDIWDRRDSRHPARLALGCARKDECAPMDVRILVSTNEERIEINEAMSQYFRNKNFIEPVICLKNYPSLDIYNGTIGELTRSGPRFSGKVARIPRSSWDLAHAITVHKYQGSEADTVIVVVNKYMTKSQLYTAITRGKRRVILTGELSSLERVIAREEKPRTSLISNFYDGTAEIEEKNE